jgi:hypothetical protein
MSYASKSMRRESRERIGKSGPQRGYAVRVTLKEGLAEEDTYDVARAFGCARRAMAEAKRKALSPLVRRVRVMEFTYGVKAGERTGADTDGLKAMLRGAEAIAAARA